MLVQVEEGVQIAVEDRGTGTPVVLLHGWSLSHEVWAPQVELLSAVGHRVVAIDLRGHGGSVCASDSDYGLPRLTDDVLAVLDTLELEQAVIVGWSLGGLVALRLAAIAPERSLRVVLIASNGVAHARHSRFPFGVAPEVVLPMLEEGELRRREDLRRKVLRTGFASTPEPEVLDRLLRISLQTGTPAALGCLRTLLGSDQVDVLHDVRAPVVQIIGRADPSVSREGSDWLQAELADAEQVVLECGHYPMLEVREAFDAALLAAVTGEGTLGMVA